MFCTNFPIFIKSMHKTVIVICLHVFNSSHIQLHLKLNIQGVILNISFTRPSTKVTNILIQLINKYYFLKVIYTDISILDCCIEIRIPLFIAVGLNFTSYNPIL